MRGYAVSSLKMSGFKNEIVIPVVTIVYLKSGWSHCDLTLCFLVYHFKPQVWHDDCHHLRFLCKKWPYLDEKVKLGRILTSILICGSLETYLLLEPASSGHFKKMQFCQAQSFLFGYYCIYTYTLKEEEKEEHMKLQIATNKVRLQECQEAKTCQSLLFLCPNKTSIDPIVYLGWKEIIHSSRLEWELPWLP